MSKKNLATCTLIAAGLFIASVPTFANGYWNNSPNATPTASTQHDTPGDRLASLTEREQSNMTYGGQVSAPSMNVSRSKPQPTTVAIPRTSRHNQN